MTVINFRKMSMKMTKTTTAIKLNKEADMQSIKEVFQSLTIFHLHHHRRHISLQALYGINY